MNPATSSITIRHWHEWLAIFPDGQFNYWPFFKLAIRGCEMKLERVMCNEHVKCAWCGQTLLGWDCVVRDDTGTYWCDDQCAEDYESEIGHIKGV